MSDAYIADCVVQIGEVCKIFNRLVKLLQLYFKYKLKNEWKFQQYNSDATFFDSFKILWLLIRIAT